MTERLKKAIQKCSLAVTEGEQLDAMEQVDDALREIVEADRRATILVCEQLARKLGAGNVADELSVMREAA